MPKSTQEALNRGNNLMVVAFINVLAVGWISEVFREDDWADKTDEILMIIFAVIALVWYLRKENRYHVSWIPFILLILTCAAKAGAIMIELNDQAAVGDDFGAIVPLFVMIIVTAIILIRTRKLTQVLA